MSDEMEEAYLFSEMVDGSLMPAAEDRDLLLLADEVGAGLARPHLDHATRSRIFVAATRLADSSAPVRSPLRQVTDHVHMTRKTGIAIGGAALVGVGAAVGLALLRGRQHRRGLALAGAAA